MSDFTQGQMVTLKSDKSIKGAIISIIDGGPEKRYQVFTNLGIQIYYASQLETEVLAKDLEKVDAERFHAGLTASLIRNPSLSSLYSLNTAKIDFIPHQFRPVLKFIRSDRPRLLIADGVGVGKTIEAGLILRELQARRNLDSVLIICPRPLVSERKWEDEMKRFDEEFVALDGDKFRHCISELDLEGEWPDKYKKAILPFSLFDESNVFGSHKGNKIKTGLMTTDPPKFDLVIVDEAHHIRNTSTYAYKAVSRFCDAAEAVVFLTATPVQLEYDDLFVLLNLLRPDLIIDKTTFHDMAEPNTYINLASTYVRAQKDGWKEAALEQIQFACTTAWGRKVFTENPIVENIIDLLQKTDISIEQRVQLITDIENLHTFSNIISRTRRRDIGEFTLRKPITVTVNFTLEQQALHDAILGILHDMLSQIHCTDNTKFMMTTIRRQTASCLFGLVPMLNEILYRHVYELVDDDSYDSGFLSSDKSAKAIKDRIKDILVMAENLPEEDPKLDAMMEIIEKKQKEPKNKVMIFSSFKHTLNYLYQKLIEKGVRVGMIHGGVEDEERRALRKRFDPAETDKDAAKALDVLLFSEVGCEGLDYQFCDCMINYDLPWNPMRVEQRIGRIDRNGQTSESVSIYNMVIPGTVDADIYDRCLMRIGVFRSSIGDCEEILGGITSEIRRLVDNFQITDEERRNKIQQMTDNKVRYIREQEELEEKQRDLFGIRVPESSFDADLKNATNFWLSAESLYNLVNCYLKSRLEADKEYILGEKALKTLRLSQAARMTLLEDFKMAKLPRNDTNRTWEKWLKSGEQHLSISFDSKYCKQDTKATLISITHPLVKQAALYLQSKGKVVSVLKAKTNRFIPGEYPFAIFQWKLSGEREDLQMKPISADLSINEHLLELLKDSYAMDYGVELSSSRWEGVEAVHHEIWERELAEHKFKTKEMIRYKEASLKTSHAARLNTLKEQLRSSKDRYYHTMTEGKIRIAEEDFNLHMEQLQQAKTKADILFELLAYG
ncbi:MAG: DEAD/DEAH box helicase, partial [Anaerotignum sp.]|nr:DEAD/DEAH box helicase [Anaerotignum sp.]